MTHREDSNPPSDAHALKDFEQLTRKHIDALWRCAFRMTGSHEIADDLTQDACLKAFRSLDQYQPGTNYRAWIFKILVNLCRDYKRRESRAPFKSWDNQEVESVLSENHDKGCQPDMQLQQSVFYTQALDAMSRLSPELRIVVSLSLLDGMSYQEIAETIEVPIGTVRSRLSRGRKKLQDALKIHITEDLCDQNPLKKRQSAGFSSYGPGKQNSLNVVAIKNVQKT